MENLKIKRRKKVCTKCGRKLFWSPSIISYLQNHYSTTKNRELSEKLGVSERTITRKAHELGLNKDPKWLSVVPKITKSYKTCRICGCTKPKKEFLKERRICLSCSSDYYKQCYRKRYPNRYDGVKYCKETQQLVEYRNGVKRKYWNPDTLSLLRRLYPTTKNEELVSLFGISFRTLNRKAAELGLSKDVEWMRNMSRHNVFFATLSARKLCAKNLIKARQVLAVKYNNPNFTKKDREKYGAE